MFDPVKCSGWELFENALAFSAKGSAAYMHKPTQTNKQTRKFTRSGAHAMVFEPYPFPLLSIFWTEPWY